MEDLTGLGKVADSRLANDIYQDAGAPALKEVGGAAVDIVKTMRLFTAPFQLAAVAQDRFRRWLDEVRSRVPAERQTEASPSVAGPALKAMLYLEEDNPLAHMFVSLLAQAIDKQHQHQVHPGFVKVLEQLSPDEAFLLRKLTERPILGVNVLHSFLEDGKQKQSSLTTFSQQGFVDPDSIYMYFEHLESLSLVRRDTESKINPPKDKPEWSSYRWYALTSFGYRFLQVCGQTQPLR